MLFNNIYGDFMEKYKEIEKSIIKKYRKEIWSKFVHAIDEYKLISENDKIAVCMSGGKDSFLLAKCMQELQRHGKVKFDLVFIVMDPGYTKKNRELIEENAKVLNIPITIFESNIFGVVTTLESGNPCYLCARMRRGHLYSKAQELGCNKIALGHHFDDVIETILLSIFYGAEFKTMMPKLHSDNFPGMELIRPLYLVRESSIISWKKSNDLTFLNCACKFTESIEVNKEEISKRKEMKELIKNINNKNIDHNIFKSASNVNFNTIIGYHKDKEKYSFLDDYDIKIYNVDKEYKDKEYILIEKDNKTFKLNETVIIKYNTKEIKVKVVGILQYDDIKSMLKDINVNSIINDISGYKNDILAIKIREI